MKNINRQSFINDFLAQKTIAVVGVSRSGTEFSNQIYAALKTKGYALYPVNPQAASIDGEVCFPTIADVPFPVDGVVIMVPSAKTLGILEQVVRCNIKRVWIHQGASSPEALSFCQSNGLQFIDGECLFMHLSPVQGGHAFHRFLRSVFGSMPQ